MILQPQPVPATILQKLTGRLLNSFGSNRNDADRIPSRTSLSDREAIARMLNEGGRALEEDDEESDANRAFATRRS